MKFMLIGFFKNYSKLLVLVSTVLCLVQIIFQIIVASFKNELFVQCGLAELLLRHVGLVRLAKLDAVSITHWIAPEIISLLGSIAALLFLSRAAKKGQTGAVEENNLNHSGETSHQMPKKRKFSEIGALKVISLIALCVTGALEPSILNIVYYIVFLGAASCWASNKKLER